MCLLQKECWMQEKHRKKLECGIQLILLIFSSLCFCLLSQYLIIDELCEIGSYVMVHSRSYHNDVNILQGGLQTLLQSIKEQDADKVSVSLASTLDTVAELELLQVTAN